MGNYAYSKDYIDDFVEVFGNMFQYVERDLGIDPSRFYSMFMQSRAARGIEAGNPKYIAGMSGVEIARDVIFEKTHSYLDIENKFYEDLGEWYWTGTVLAYYQWSKNVRFSMINSLGLTVDKIRGMYILHEADISKFVEQADRITGLGYSGGRALAYYRKMKNMSQRDLSQKSDVPLRMIQLYEQGQNDIRKANVDYVARMANALDVKIEMLI